MKEINEKLKRDMMALWKETFHDSEDYIRLVFDNYFNPRYALHRYDGDKLIASMLGVPYGFTAIDGNNHKVTIRGLYLCGLATDTSYRRRGVMSELLEEINRIARDENFDFTFLIPASADLSRYYFKHRYVDCFRRLKNRYAKNHCFNTSVSKGDIEHDMTFSIVNSCDSKILSEKGNLLSSFAECYNRSKGFENRNCGFVIDHTPRDLSLILQEALLSGLRILYLTNAETIVAFCCAEINDNEVLIPHIFAINDDVKTTLLEIVNQSYQEKSISLYDYPECDNDLAIWSPAYTAYDGNLYGNADWKVDRVTRRSEHAENYGMARIVRVSEILKFLAGSSSDLKFSILVEDDTDGTILRYTVEGGLLIISGIDDKGEEKFLTDGNTERVSTSDDYRIDDVLSTKELAEILWRKDALNDEVGKAFCIPRLPFNMSYLLD